MSRVINSIKDLEEAKEINPATVTYKKKIGILEVKTTHAEPVVKTESHNIEELRAKTAAIDGAMRLWEGTRRNRIWP